MNSTLNQTASRKIGIKAVAAMLTGVAALSVALATSKPVHADASYGARDGNEVVSANDRDTYYITFNGGEEAYVEANDYSNDDIDLYVYDEYGDLVAVDDMSDGDPICTWTPDETQQYTIYVVNRTQHDVAYEFTTN